MSWQGEFSACSRLTAQDVGRIVGERLQLSRNGLPNDTDGVTAEYVDNNMVGTGKLRAAAIIGQQGGVWATSSQFDVSCTVPHLEHTHEQDPDHGYKHRYLF